MMEITNDIRFLLPIMTAILISKLVADQITHSLYHALLELKCIPFIGGDPPPHTTSLDSHAVSQIMNKNVIVFPIESTAVAIIDTLKKCQAHAFPIVEGRVFVGTVLRKHILNLLRSKSGVELTYAMLEGTEGDQDYEHEIPKFEEIKLLNIFSKVSRNISFRDVVDTSAMSVRQDFPIKRSYIIFRSLGLRHLTVVDKFNVPVGIVTRKDLLGMHIEQSLHEDHGTAHDVATEKINPLDNTTIDPLDIG